jgi:hypothetical protein
MINFKRELQKLSMIGKVNREIGMTNMPSSLLACLQTQLLLRVIGRCTANYNLELQKAGQPGTYS